MKRLVLALSVQFVLSMTASGQARSGVQMADSTILFDSGVFDDEIPVGKAPPILLRHGLEGISATIVDSIDRHDHNLQMYPLENVEAIANQARAAGLPWFYSRHTTDRYEGLLDETNVPLVNYNFGVHRNPVTTAQAALAFFNSYLTTGEARDSLVFMANVQWLLDNHDDFYLRYDFDWTHAGRFLPKGWVSAMAQGEALAVMSAAFHLTRDSTYFEAATGFFRTMYSNAGDTWTIVVDANGYYWLEEYPNADRCHVLNGMLFGLWGLWNYYVISGDTFALELFRAGIASIVDHIDFWNLPGRNDSRYCLHGLRYEYYHDTHLQQLNDYLTVFDVPALAQAVERLQEYEQWHLMPSALDLGYVLAGTVARDTVTIYSTGTGPLELTKIQTDSPSWSVGIEQASVAPGDSLRLPIELAADSPGRASCRITMEHSFSPQIILYASAQVVPEPLFLDGSSVSFDPIVALNSDARTIPIVNLTDVAVAVDTAYADHPYFNVTGTWGDVAAGEIAELSLVYTPLTVGEHAAIITAVIDDVPRQALIQARAEHPLRVGLPDPPGLMDFGSVEAGVSDTLTLDVENLSDHDVGPIEVTTTTDVFSAPGSHFMLGPRAHWPLLVVFHPPGEGQFEAQLLISSPVSSEPITLTLRGTSGIEVNAESPRSPSHLGITVYPNPTAGRATVELDLDRPSAVRIQLFDALGRGMAMLLDEVRPAGSYTMVADLSHLPAGVYFVRLEADDRRETRRLMILP